MKMIHNATSKTATAHYSPAVAYNGTLYVSGQLPTDPATGTIPEGGIRPQARQSLKNVEAVLKLAGCTKEDVVSCRVYIPDIKYWGELNEEYADFFGEHRPARVVVPVNNFNNGCLVEIEAVAAYKGEE